MKTEKKIEDFIHLYIGCEVFGTYNDNSGSKGILTGVTNGGHECEIQFILEDGINVEEDPEWNETKEVKLILRPLSDKNMSTDELREWCKRRQRKGWMPGVHADNTAWLLSKRFDLFDLIPAGLAIDKNTL
jgi:hypothetical protein